MAAADESAREMDFTTQSAMQRAAEARRRKVRKGTHSCWECRRRKIRCQYAALDDVVCIGCRARGSACRSQEFADDSSAPAQAAPEKKVSQRLDRLEHMMERLMTHVLAAAPPVPGSEHAAGHAGPATSSASPATSTSVKKGQSHHSTAAALEDVQALAEMLQRDPEELVARVCPAAAARNSEAYRKDVLETSAADNTPVAALLGIQGSLSRQDNDDGDGSSLAGTAVSLSPPSAGSSREQQSSPEKEATSDEASSSTPRTAARSTASTTTTMVDRTAATSIAAQPVKSMSLDTSHQHQLSTMLHTLFPCQEDINMITTGAPAHFITTFFHSQHDIDNGRGEPPESLAVVPPVTSHPTVIARRLLQLVICMQQMAPCFERQQRLHFTDSVAQVIRRIAAVVTQTVTSSDDLVGSVEGLECIVLLGQQQSNAGQLRRSWLSYRRAMSLAQLMGVDRGSTRAFKSCDPTADPRRRPTPEAIWYRINAGDRHLSLLLGLQAGWKAVGRGHEEMSPDGQCRPEFAADTDSPVERLQKTHTALTGSIIERNHNGTSLEEAHAATMAIDRCLRVAAARDLDAAWWRIPSYDLDAEPTFVIREMARSVLQVQHHCILILLHLPYMLRSSQPLPVTAEEAAAAGSPCAAAKQQLALSKTTCMQSSREVLERFLQFRMQVRSAFSCRHVDYATLIAAMTLIIGYLGPRPAASAEQQVQDAFDRQLRQDQAMVQMVHDRMVEIGQANDDKLSLESAATIQKLAPILDLVGRKAAADAGSSTVAAPAETGPLCAAAQMYGFGEDAAAKSGNLPDAETAVAGSSSHMLAAVRLDVPYFGTVNIHPPPPPPEATVAATGRPWIASPSLSGLSGLSTAAFAPPQQGLFGTPPPVATAHGDHDATMLHWQGAAAASPSSLLIPDLLQPQAPAAMATTDFNAMLVDFDPMPPFSGDSSGTGNGDDHNHYGSQDSLTPSDGMFAFGTTPACPDITGASDDWVMQGVDTTYWSLLNGGAGGGGGLLG